MEEVGVKKASCSVQRRGSRHNPGVIVSFTGHSLGGGLARCAEMQARSRLTTSKPPADTEFSP